MSQSINKKTIHANHLHFETDTCGDGDKLALCLHGFPECSYSWRFQLPFLADLGYTVWAPNLRGYGNSSRPKRVSDYSIRNLCADVARLIDAANKRSTLLIGHDWGAAIAWSFAIQRIRPIDRLVIMNVPHPAIFMKHLFRWPQILRSWYIFFFQIPGLPEWLFRLQHAKAIGDAFRNMAVDKSRFPDEVLQVYRDNAMIPGALTAMINYYRAVWRGLPSKDELRQMRNSVIDVPTLMIWGEHDAALGKELTYGTDKYVRDLTLHYLPDASHWVQQEDPQQVNALIKAWLADRASSVAE